MTFSLMRMSLIKAETSLPADCAASLRLTLSSCVARIRIELSILDPLEIVLAIEIVCKVCSEGVARRHRENNKRIQVGAYDV